MAFMGPLWSSPWTAPLTPTASANDAARKPGPEPMSRTRSPGRTAMRARTSARCWTTSGVEDNRTRWRAASSSNCSIDMSDLLRTASLSAGSPRLVRVREPDHLGGEPADQQLAFGLRLVELAEPHRCIAGDDDRTLAGLDDHHLRAGCVARCREEPDPGKQLELAGGRHVPHSGRLDPFAEGVVVLAARVVEFSTLDVDRLAGEDMVAAAVVEVQ